MRKSTLLPLVILLSVVFNIGYIITDQMQVDSTGWPFFEVGPSIVQDSYYIRAPGLESTFGIIGDIPGGYSLYTGSPLQTGVFDNRTSTDMVVSWAYGQPMIDSGIILLGALFAAIPVSLMLFLGRRSYGSTKTQ